MNRPARASDRPHMLRPILVLALLTVSGTGCSGSGTDLELDDPVDPEYTLSIGVPVGEDAIANLHDFSGVKAWWDPYIGHLELGPEDVTSGPLASFWMTLDPACIDPDTGELSIACAPQFFFYVIWHPEQPLGAQEAYSYSPDLARTAELDRGDIITAIDGNGVPIIRGIMSVWFNINAPAIGELPASAAQEILVTANFVAVNER